VFLTLVSLGLALVPQVSSQPENIKVVDYSWYIDSLGYFVVIGEVQNVGPNTIDSVVLSGTVYTSDGAAQANSYTGAYVQYLIPQQKAPFYMDFPPQSSFTGDLSWLSLGVDRVDFSIDAAEATSSYQYPDLTVTSSSGGADAEGVYWVSGTVQNTGNQSATNVLVIGTFYNASGTVIATGYTNPLTPTSLTPSSTASFKVGAFDLNQSVVPSTLKIASYSLLIQTEGPILSGTAPTIPPSTPSATATPSDNTPSPTASPGSENPNVLAPEAIYTIIIVIVIIGLVVTLLIFRKTKSPEKPQKMKRRKSQKRKKLK
jgi:hypothetical protein